MEYEQILNMQRQELKETKAKVLAGILTTQQLSNISTALEKERVAYKSAANVIKNKDESSLMLDQAAKLETLKNLFNLAIRRFYAYQQPARKIGKVSQK